MCVSTPATGGPCDDGEPCYTGDTCKLGACTPGPIATVCKKTQQCTHSYCEPYEGCVETPITAGCQDGNPCTIGDLCEDGECLPGAPSLCDDGDPCTADACDPKSGCIHSPISGNACDDGNPCTASDLCQAGMCTAGATICLCTDDSDCELGNACVAPLACTSGVCAPTGAAPSCPEPKSPCLVATCDPKTGACGTKAISGGPCDDGEPCTVFDLCQAGGLCQGSPVLCDDYNPCTHDLCAPDLGCTNTPITDKACDDQDPCTSADECQGGLCLGGAWVCPECTSSADCNATLPPSPCTQGYQCLDGDCLPAKPWKDCEWPDNPCQTATCDPSTGLCVTTNLPDGAPCEDFDPCTGAAHCTAAKCVASPIECASAANECGTAFCDPDEGGCVELVDEDDCAAKSPCLSALEIDCRSSVNSTLGDDAQDAVKSSPCALGIALNGPEKSYAFEAPCTGTITVKVTPTGSWSAAIGLLLLPGNSAECSTQACLLSHVPSAANKPATLSFLSQAGAPWIVVLDGVAGATGSYELQLDCDCP